ncbi:universal stress protein [Mumia sp. DW29H23]|uniref:universal stress protein n=1 Tax=Mumia sp. DW29H23 TaxID=3421241 RepID=UPI003D686FC5
MSVDRSRPDPHEERNPLAHLSFRDLQPREERLRRRPIVVGIDGTTHSALALQWATIRAFAGRTSLHVVHAYRSSVSSDPFGVVYWWDPAPLALAEQLVARAAAQARALAPTLTVTTAVRSTTAAAALIAEGREAELIVVGRSRTKWFRPLTWSVNAKVARHARGRVVIVDEGDEVLV